MCRSKIQTTIFKAGKGHAEKVCVGFKFKFALLSIMLSFMCGTIWGQRLSVSTNLLNYLNFGTINGEISLGISQHFSLYVQGKYNPFKYKYNYGTRQLNNRQLAFAVGAKWWPWHLYSGWFLSGQTGFTRYNRGGIVSQDTYEGDAYGITVGAGYALMINRHINMDFGIGVIGGYTDFVKYACPSCGKIKNRGKKIFVAPNNVLVQLSYLF